MSGWSKPLHSGFCCSRAVCVFYPLIVQKLIVREKHPPFPSLVHNHSSRFSTELSVSEPWISSAQILVPSSGWGESCRLSPLWQECLMSVSSHLASPLFCILNTPLPPETEVCPRLWLLSALCWGHRWPGRRCGNTFGWIQLREPGCFISWVRSVTSTQAAIIRLDGLNLLISVLGQVHRLSVTLLSSLPLASIVSSTPYLPHALLCAPTALRVHVHRARDQPVSRLHVVCVSSLSN